MEVKNVKDNNMVLNNFYSINLVMTFRKSEE
jgi:hypothetical protein